MFFCYLLFCKWMDDMWSVFVLIVFWQIFFWRLRTKWLILYLYSFCGTSIKCTGTIKWWSSSCGVYFLVIVFIRVCKTPKLCNSIFTFATEGVYDHLMATLGLLKLHFIQKQKSVDLIHLHIYHIYVMVKWNKETICTKKFQLL